jgi:hypothetical protein|mmetsp:Transcript_58122/g.93740  ORF Transcript_58122/g.93740 Transcript_58122/m.93740 type:complete len:114 (-) Transcript_58122:915-1256(-)
MCTGIEKAAKAVVGNVAAASPQRWLLWMLVMLSTAALLLLLERHSLLQLLSYYSPACNWLYFCRALSADVNAKHQYHYRTTSPKLGCDPCHYYGGARGGMRTLIPPPVRGTAL